MEQHSDAGLGYCRLNYGSGDRRCPTGTPVITYQLPTGCETIIVVSVNPTITPFVLTGGGSYCATDSGVHIGLLGSVLGVNYQLFDDGIAIGAAQPGTGASIDFGLETLPGNYSVVASNGTCTANMGDSVNIVVNPVPIAYGVYGGGSYCSGSGGVHVNLSGSNIGINYILVNNGSVVGTPFAGTGFLLDFGADTASGVYQVAAVNTVTGCTSNMSGTATIVDNPLPVLYSVAGGGSYCSGGTGVHITLTGSNVGVNYQLYNGSTVMGSVVPGTGSGIDFGLQTATGTYTINAVNATTGCSKSMSGSATISTTPLPAAFAVTGGGSYCTGGTGVHVGLGFSNSGINYQLYNGSSPVGSPLSGTNAALDFGLQTAAGTYSVNATNATTGCTNGMSGSVAVTLSPLPTAFAINGGGSYCAGDTGVHIGLNGSYSWC